MSTVCDYATCPECGFDDALYEMDLGRRAEMLFCPRCGFDWRFITIIDGQTGQYKRRKDGGFIEREYKKKSLFQKIPHYEKHLTEYPNNVQNNPWNRGTIINQLYL